MRMSLTFSDAAASANIGSAASTICVRIFERRYPHDPVQRSVSTITLAFKYSVLHVSFTFS
jgi:hypothetical protein